MERVKIAKANLQVTKEKIEKLKKETNDKIQKEKQDTVRTTEKPKK
jgi:ABC-type Zn uptake system ZnuABC Zn-binding protein ZnuA